MRWSANRDNWAKKAVFLKFNLLYNILLNLFNNN